MEITLAPFNPQDFHRILQWIPDEKSLMLWSGPFFTYPLSESQLQDYYLSCLLEPPIRRIYKATNQETGQVVGHIELNNIDFRNRAASVSKVLVGDPFLRGQGIAGQMVSRLLEIAFGDLNLHRISLYVFDFNQPAIACYQKAGFQIEGHLRDFRRNGEDYWCSYLMSLIEEDWLTLHPDISGSV